MSIPHPTISHREAPRRWLGYLALAVSVTLIVVATLTPRGDQTGYTVFQCIFCGQRALADALLNAILYVPLGMGLALAGVRARPAVLTGALLSAAVEVAQIALPGRDSSIGDVLANTGGTALGVLLVVTAAFWLRPSNGLSGRLALGWAAGVVTVWGLTGWLLAPSSPKTLYYGQWTPKLGHLESYRGRVLNATVGQDEIRSRRAPNSEALRRNLLEGVPVEIKFVAGPRTSDVSSIFSIYDEHQQEILLIGAHRDDLVFRYRTRAADVRLDQPDLRFPGLGAALQVGDTISLTVNRTENGWAIEIAGMDSQQLGFTIASGWSLLSYGESFPAWLRAALDVAWIAALLMPLGYWIRRDVYSGTALTMCLLGSFAVPHSFGLFATPANLWIAMALGLFLGAAASQAMRRLLRAAPDNAPAHS